jgi:tetratricopeptide (TPR) repeat protein/nucleoside phosphorylase
VSVATDVLIICALKEELDALLEVSSGLTAAWIKIDGDPPYHTATFNGAAGPIRIAAARQTEMAGVAAAAVAVSLAARLKPRCLAMCGVCAGHPDDTDLGDVVIADRVFQHDNGKQKAGGFEGDLRTHVSDDRWLHAAQDLAGPATRLHGYAGPEPDAYSWWFLERLLTDRHPLRSGFSRYFADERRAELLESLLERELVCLQGESFALTEKGRAAAQRRRVIHGTRAGTLPYRVHVGPIGSGNYVVADGGIWARLAEMGMRKILAVEMEAAAIGAIAHRHRLPFVVAKGVMDHGDKHKSDRFKEFAARASAEVLCEFLRRAYEPEPRVHASAEAVFEGPRADRSFTGRDDELAELERLVLANRSVCVVATGIGGIGKTTLVAEFAATPGRELFPDGSVWIDGSHDRIIAELARVGRRFGWSDTREPTTVEAVRLLNETLAGKRVLVVVDNFDPDRNTKEQVPIPGGEARTLVTSRARTLDDILGGERLELGVWTIEACREYLRKSCPQLSRVADARVDALAQFVGRLPLGVKLLVSLLRHRRGTSAVELLRQLEAQPLGTLDKYAADRGVAKTFSAAFGALSDEARRVLQALAACARQTRADIVAAVAGIADVGELLDELHNRGFAELAFESDKPWGLHDVVRMFVLTQPESEEFAERQLEWVQRHRQEHADPTAYLDFAEGVEEAKHAFARLLCSDIEAADAIYRPLQKHLRVVGRNADAVELSESMLSAASPGSIEAATALNILGLCHGTLGDIAKAIEHHERALAIEEKLGRLEGQAMNLGNLGLCYRTLGGIAKAIEHHERSLAIEEKLGRLEGQAADLGNLGLCYRTLGDIAKAIEHHERSLAINEKLGRLEGQAKQLGNLGLCYQTLGDIAKAIEHHERSLAINEKLGRLEGQANQLGNLGVCYRRLGEIARAIEHHERALALDEKLGGLEGQAADLRNLGVCYEQLGDVPFARDLFTRARELYLRMGFPGDHPSVLMVERALARLR